MKQNGSYIYMYVVWVIINMQTYVKTPPSTLGECTRCHTKRAHWWISRNQIFVPAAACLSMVNLRGRMLMKFDFAWKVRQRVQGGKMKRWYLGGVTWLWAPKREYMTLIISFSLQIAIWSRKTNHPFNVTLLPMFSDIYFSKLTFILVTKFTSLELSANFK